MLGTVLTLGIQCILNSLIQLHLRIVIEPVRRRNLIHQCQMRPILPPPMRCAILDQLFDQAMRPDPTFRVFAVEDKADNMMQLAEADDESSDEIEAVFFAAFAGDAVLELCICAGDAGDGGEE